MNFPVMYFSSSALARIVSLWVNKKKKLKKNKTEIDYSPPNGRKLHKYATTLFLGAVLNENHRLLVGYRRMFIATEGVGSLLVVVLNVSDRHVKIYQKTFLDQVHRIRNVAFRRR